MSIAPSCSLSFFHIHFFYYAFTPCSFFTGLQFCVTSEFTTHDSLCVCGILVRFLLCCSYKELCFCNWSLVGWDLQNQAVSQMLPFRAHSPPCCILCTPFSRPLLSYQACYSSTLHHYVKVISCFAQNSYLLVLPILKPVAIP